MVDLWKVPSLVRVFAISTKIDCAGSFPFKRIVSLVKSLKYIFYIELIHFE